MCVYIKNYLLCNPKFKNEETKSPKFPKHYDFFFLNVKTQGWEPVIVIKVMSKLCGRGEQA